VLADQDVRVDQNFKIAFMSKSTKKQQYAAKSTQQFRLASSLRISFLSAQSVLPGKKKKNEIKITIHLSKRNV